MITRSQLDIVFDWLDKIRAASAHMGVALRGHDTRLGYREIDFPNRRIGAFDRLALFFRVSSSMPQLDLWHCLNMGFLTTPTAIALKIKDLMIVFVSGNFLLSDVFGLGVARPTQNDLEYFPGFGLFASGLNVRKTRIPTAKIFAQPMRQQLKKEVEIEKSVALREDGSGKIYELVGSRWVRAKSCDFGKLPRLYDQIGYLLASLETIEWIILCKEMDYKRYGTSNSFFMKSMPQLHDDKQWILGILSDLRGGLLCEDSDRFS